MPRRTYASGMKPVINALIRVSFFFISVASSRSSCIPTHFLLVMISESASDMDFTQFGHVNLSTCVPSPYLPLDNTFSRVPALVHIYHRKLALEVCWKHMVFVGVLWGRSPGQNQQAKTIDSLVLCWWCVFGLLFFVWVCVWLSRI